MVTAKGSGTATTETPDGASTSSSELVDSGVEVLGTVPQCEITFGAGFTKPTEPYANVKVYVQMKLTGDVGEHDALYEFAEGWVNEKLTENMQALNEQFGS
jgi:hypothetical protein